MAKQICGSQCNECIICEGSKICCNHNYKYHGCNTWQRKESTGQSKSTMVDSKAGDKAMTNEEYVRRKLAALVAKRNELAHEVEKLDVQMKMTKSMHLNGISNEAISDFTHEYNAFVKDFGEHFFEWDFINDLAKKYVVPKP